MSRPDTVRSRLWVDSAAHTHPIVLEIGNAAFGAWVRLACWAQEQATGGRVLAVLVKKWASPSERRALLAAGLLTEEEGGDYMLHGSSSNVPLLPMAFAEKPKGGAR